MVAEGVGNTCEVQHLECCEAGSGAGGLRGIGDVASTIGSGKGLQQTLSQQHLPLLWREHAKEGSQQSGFATAIGA